MHPGDVFQNRDKFLLELSIVLGMQDVICKHEKWIAYLIVALLN